MLIKKKKNYVYLRRECEFSMGVKMKKKNL